MPKTRIKKKTDTTGGFQDLGYTLTEDEIRSFNNKVDKVTSTDNAIARFDGTTGIIQNSKVTITDAGKIIAPSFASDATEAGMVFSDNNELNFGSNSNTLYIGYRNKLNTSGSVGIYNFGTSSGSTGMTSGRINAGDIYSNSKKVATETFVADKIAELVDAAPSELNTLKELAEGITANKDVLETVTEAVGKKVDKVTSTDNAIARFDGTNGAIQNSKVTIDDNGVIYSNNTKVALTSDLTNVVKTTTNNTFTANNIFKNNAFEIRANSASDDSWIKLTNATDSGYYAFGIRRPYDMYGLQMKIHPDTGNDQYIDILHSGNYTKYAEPKITTKNSAFNKNFGTAAGTVCEGNDSRLSNARTPTAHTHVKSEITDFPTIPTVNNGTLTIQKNGTTVKTFTANQSSNVTANITVPTKTSELTNDSGFITSAPVTSVNNKTGAVTLTASDVGALPSSTVIPKTYYGTCETVAATVAKVVTCSEFSSLTTGAVITVKFTYANDARGVTLNVNGTGAKTIHYRNYLATWAGPILPWKAHDTLTFRYDGTYWVIVGHLDTDTTYTLSSFGVTATSTELNCCDGVTSNIQTQLDAKADVSAIPTTTSQLTNDSGFITSADLPSGGVTSVVGQTGDVTVGQIKSAMLGFDGGFAIGNGANTSSGVAIGENASALSGGGIALGKNTDADNGSIAIGYNAKCFYADSVQIGTGTNYEYGSLQFKDYQLVNENGYIPFDRLQHIASTHLDDLEFTTIFEGDVGSGAITIEGGKSLCDYRIIFILGANDARNGAEWKMYYGWQFREMASNTLVNSVVLSTSHTTGGWLIRRDSLTSTTTLTQTEENMRIYAIYGMN